MSDPDGPVPPAREPHEQADAGPDADARPRRRWSDPATIGTVLLLLTMVVAGIGAAIMVTPAPDEESLARPDDSDVVVAGGAPRSWDPASVNDAISAQMLSQVFEGLTRVGPDGEVEPALAGSWTVEDGGRRIVFDLRDGLTFSDGRGISADDVRRSWMRVLDPARQNPLASLLDDVAGAAAFARGDGVAEDVGLVADGDRLIVRFERPASFFPAVASVPTLAVVPPDIDRLGGGPSATGGDIAASGPYVPIEQTTDLVRLQANGAYWGELPSIERVTVITDDGGRSSVDVFEDQAVDWTRIGPADASWVRYDQRLGPQLRRTDDQAVDFVGFDTTRSPFDDPSVRRAVAMAVDWDRLARIGEAPATPATSIVPPGIAGRDESDHVLPHDPDAARAELADAGYPDGDGFPDVAIATYGVGPTEAIAEELRRELGIEVSVERRPFGEHSALLDNDPPPMWTLSWSADYPHAHDFLGLLLRTGSSANSGGWSEPAYDALIDEAAALADPDAQRQLYAQAQAIVREQAPLIPMSYSDSWSLGREGLDGVESAEGGTLRYADLAWH